MTPGQLKKAIAFNKKEEAEGDFSDKIKARLTEYWQQNHPDAGKVDSWCGAQTQGSVEDDMLESGYGAPTIPVHLVTDSEEFVDGKWLHWDGPEEKQPRRYAEAVKYFGKSQSADDPQAFDQRWYRKNIVSAKGLLPGVPSKWYVKVHRIILPYLIEGLRRAAIVSPEYEVGRLGAFVFRHIRHNPKNALSMHAWGVAFDIDPGRNQAIMFKRGQSPKAWSPEYYKHWPRGVPAPFVQSLESCGFTWGNDWDSDGRTDDHRWLDPMHFEWIARDGNQFDV